jgi:hypothetical protein
MNDDTREVLTRSKTYLLDLLTKSAGDFDAAIRAAADAEYKRKKEDESAFKKVMAALIAYWLLRAFLASWKEHGEGGEMPLYLVMKLNAMIAEQEGYISQYQADIRAASDAGQPIEPLLTRAELWANRYGQAEDDALLEIARQSRKALEWVYGDTDHCSTCEDLNGVVAYADDWKRSGLYPQNAPNPHLECGGWHCQCRWIETDEIPADDVFLKLSEIAMRRVAVK